jgi:hypothetical protein
MHTNVSFIGKVPKFLRIGGVALVILSLGACSTLSSGYERTLATLGLSEAPVETVKPAEPEPVVEQAKNIELLWHLPTEPVDAYHVIMLDQSGKEVRKYRVPVQKLQKLDHPTHGPVYRYLLPGVGDSNSVVIRAENRFGLSEPSEPLVVE